MIVKDDDIVRCHTNIFMKNSIYKSLWMRTEKCKFIMINRSFFWNCFLYQYYRNIHHHYTGLLFCHIVYHNQMQWVMLMSKRNMSCMCLWIIDKPCIFYILNNLIYLHRWNDNEVLIERGFKLVDSVLHFITFKPSDGRTIINKRRLTYGFD